MKTHDKLGDWLYSVPSADGRKEFYTTYSFETGLTFILMDFFKEENKSEKPDSVTVFSLYKGEPDEEQVMKCIEEGGRISFSL